MAQSSCLPLALHQAAERIGAAAQTILPDRAHGVPSPLPQVDAQLAGWQQQLGESLSVLAAAFAVATSAAVATAATTPAASAGAFILQQQQQPKHDQQQQYQK